MDLFNKLKDRKIDCIELSGIGSKLRKQWEEVFAQHLTTTEKRKIHLHATSRGEGYLWHIFSYGKRECLKENEAEMLFDETVKDLCFIFFQHSEDALKVENASALKAKDLKASNGEYSDVYVVDSQFKWTFIVTHENGWLGPYFSKR